MMPTQAFEITTTDSAEFSISDLQRQLEADPCVVCHPGREQATYIFCEHPSYTRFLANNFKYDVRVDLTAHEMVVLSKAKLRMRLSNSH